MSMRPFPPSFRDRAMETPAQTIDRLLSALENLARDEHHLIDTDSIEAALAVQEREQPLVTRITELLHQPGLAASLPAATCNRVQSLLAAQQWRLKLLSTKMAANRDELAQLNNAQKRIQLLRPSYGNNPATRNLVGEA